MSKHVTADVLLAAADALAGIVRDDEVNATYIIPSVFHPELSTVVAEAVQAAAQAGTAEWAEVEDHPDFT